MIFASVRMNHIFVHNFHSYVCVRPNRTQATSQVCFCVPSIWKMFTVYKCRCRGDKTLREYLRQCPINEQTGFNAVTWTGYYTSSPKYLLYTRWRHNVLCLYTMAWHKDVIKDYQACSYYMLPRCSIIFACLVYVLIDVLVGNLTQYGGHTEVLILGVAVGPLASRTTFR